MKLPFLYVKTVKRLQFHIIQTIIKFMYLFIVLYI